MTPIVFRLTLMISSVIGRYPGSLIRSSIASRKLVVCGLLLSKQALIYLLLGGHVEGVGGGVLGPAAVTLLQGRVTPQAARGILV